MIDIDVQKDPENLTMDITARLAASPKRVWQLWEDPRQLERWWGPPGYPATVTEHDLTPGGSVRYHMTGPDGEQPKGWWRVLDVSPPHRLVFEDGFADDDGVPNHDMPVTTSVVTIEAVGGDTTTMHLQTTFPSLEALEQMLEMGMEEGIVQALRQIEDVLADPR